MLVWQGGSYGIVPTPFFEDERLDLGSLARAVQFYLRGGAHGVVVLAVMGEGHKVLEAERASVIRTAVEAAQGRSVVVGITGAGTKLVSQRVEEAQALGASAVLAAPPQALMDEAYLRHFAALGEVGLPVVLQDHPESTGIQLSVATLVRIVREVQHVTAIKLEAPPTGAKIQAIRQHLDARECAIFGGLGGLHLMDELMAGGDGTMTGFAFPEVLSEVVRLFHTGDRDGAERLHEQNLPWLLHEATPQSSLAIRKEFLRLHGVLAGAALRAPARSLDESALRRTRMLFDRYMQLRQNVDG